MAGDWIKMRVDLRDDPAVILMSAILKKDQDIIVGKLHRLWSWADKHTSDGRTPGINIQWVDRYVSCKGFAQAMQKAKWLIIAESFIEFPNFERHNGESAKRRGEAQIRQRLSREARGRGESGNDRDLMPSPFRRYVLNRDNFTCVFCGTESSISKESHPKTSVLSVDHLVPNARGGQTVIENLATCCRLCNSEKNDRTPEEWGLLPTFLEDGVSYDSGHIVVTTTCDSLVTKAVTREEKTREDERKNHSFKSDRKTIGSSSPNGNCSYRSDQSPKEMSGVVNEEPLDLSNVDWEHVIAMADRIARKIPPRSDEDRRAWLKYAVLADVTFGEDWLVDAIEAVTRSSETKKTRQAHFVGVLKSKAKAKDVDGETFIGMVRRIEIPSEVWHSGAACT